MTIIKSPAISNITPANSIVETGGVVKLTDFNIGSYKDTLVNSSHFESSTLILDNRTLSLPVVTSAYSNIHAPTIQGTKATQTLSFTRFGTSSGHYGVSKFKTPSGFWLKDIGILIEKASQIASARVLLWDITKNKMIEWSGYLKNTELKANTENKFSFSGSTYIQPNKMYGVIIVGYPSHSVSDGEAASTGYIVLPRYGVDDRAKTISQSYDMYEGKYPIDLKTWRKTFVSEAYNPIWLYGTKKVHQLTGMLTSVSYPTTYPIKTVQKNVNITLPTETRYETWVSNDGGAHYYQMTGDSYTFTSSGTNVFKYQLKLFTSNTGKTPVVAYDGTDENIDNQYAIQFNFIFEGGTTPPLTGTFTTAEISTSSIISTYLPNTTNPIYSHIEWLRLWMKENDGSIAITIKRSDDGTTYTNWKTGLSLEDFEQISVDYAAYEEALDSDEYNFYCDFENNPYYWKYVQFVVTLTRPLTTSVSPEVRKVGAIIMLE